VSVLTRRGLKGLLNANTIIIPGWRNPEEPPPQRLIRMLIAAHERGARLVSICSGIFVLAATGLLNDRRATTHWRYIEKLGSAFPAIRLQPDVLYVDEGDILTSAGSAAGIDLCLHLIRKDFGTLTANRVARRLVVSPHREGGQAQFIDKPVGEQASPWLSHLLHWAQERLHDPITVAQLAKRAGMSKRTLSRRFVEMTGTSPLDWITSLRVRRGERPSGDDSAFDGGSSGPMRAWISAYTAPSLSCASQTQPKCISCSLSEICSNAALICCAEGVVKLTRPLLMPTVLIATSNAGKLRDFAGAAGPLGVTIQGIPRFSFFARGGGGWRDLRS